MADSPKADRRSFLQILGALGVGVGMGPGKAHANAEAMNVGDWPAMPQVTYGRTGFKGSRLVFGCGAALSGGQANNLLGPALDAGINVFDVGTKRYYKDAEKHLGPFISKIRDRALLISKAMLYVDVGAQDEINTAVAREAAKNWSRLLDESLGELGTDHIDAYYVMAANNVGLTRSEEMHEAFLAAKQSGKVKYWGISTHENAEAVTEAAADTGWYDLMQIAITPAGWYDWESKNVLGGSPDMKGLRPVLDRARSAGIALIGMKAGRHLAGRWWLGGGNEKAYDEHYPDTLLKAGLNGFQRSYAYVLEHGLDAVNADMQSFEHLQQNFVATAQSKTWFV
tara:strand:- start:5651 stop:6670 length:1020 start_codon:yes stop_codon:yes gene_type:complete